jgi:transketolase
MRREFVESLVNIAERDERVVLLTGDLGFAALEPFSERFPDRFFNAGVAEQNMVGMATGLAEAGLTPYVYSISTFASMRAYEFIRNGPVLHDLPVRIVGIGEGTDYSHNGITHYALEDVALMRAQPGLTLVNPASSSQVAPLMRAVQAVEGPVYVRLSKAFYDVPGLPDAFELGRAHVIGCGHDVAIVALGATAANAVSCADLLAARGVQASVIVVSSINPAPVDDLVEALAQTRFAISVEAHYVTGGVGSLAAEVIAENGLECRLVRAGATAAPVGLTGSLGYTQDQLGISPQRLADRVLETMGARREVGVL